MRRRTFITGAVALVASPSIVMTVGASPSPSTSPSVSNTITSAATTSSSQVSLSYATGDPARQSRYNADMSSFHQQLQSDPMVTSMRAVLKTAVPQSYKDAIATNKASVKAQFKTEPPEWYKDMPEDVRSFMESNTRAALSIYTKDFGVSLGAGSGKSVVGKSEAPSGASLVGAVMGVLVGAVGVGVLLL